MIKHYRWLLKTLNFFLDRSLTTHLRLNVTLLSTLSESIWLVMYSSIESRINYKKEYYKKSKNV
jgi:hypothetical protein